MAASLLISTVIEPRVGAMPSATASVETAGCEFRTRRQRTQARRMSSDTRTRLVGPSDEMVRSERVD